METSKESIEYIRQKLLLVLCVYVCVCVCVEMGGGGGGRQLLFLMS
jgi:hypothetical protein